MFSPFSQKTQGSSQAFNPFAPRPTGEGASFGSDGAGGSNSLNKSKRKNGFGGDSDVEKKLNVNNPFKGKDGSLSDSGRQWKKRGGDGEKKPAENKKNSKKARGGTKGLQQNTDGRSNGVQAATSAEDDNTSRPSSSSSASSIDEKLDNAAMRATDPYSKKVYDRLRKDGISPPSWPSQPGNPNSKTEMAKFREKYEEYRQKVRASLTKASLIDDPDKRKTLENAITFRGICEDMCSEYEKITRITELDVPQPEKDARTGYAKTSKMVKKLARSAAGQEAPLPMDVRSTAALRRTLDYLIDDLLRDDENLPGLHGFLWDRTRAIRRDFTFFSSPTADDLKTQAYVLENIARFHVTALHLLSQPGKAGEDFVEQQELEQLGKALLSLRDLYDDCNAQGITCENEAEFRAYYLLFHAHDSNTVEMLQRQWKPHFWRDSDDIRTAVSLVEALQNTADFHGPLKAAPFLAASNAFHSFFRIVEDPSVSYTMACFAECHFPQLRRSILRAVKRALARPKDTANDLTAAALNKFLRFDTVQEAIDFAKLHGIEFVPDKQAPMDPDQQCLILNNKEPLRHPRLHHQFSQTLVEKKRRNRPLPDVMHKTIYEDSTTSFQSGSFSTQEGSLFMPDTAPVTPAESPPIQPQNSTSLPAFGQPLSGFGSNPLGTQQASEQPASIFGAPDVQKSTPFSNPFASASTPFGSKPTLGSTAPALPSSNAPTTANPFASAITSSNASQNPSALPSILGGSTAVNPVNPFAQAAPTPSPSFSGFQSKPPSQPQTQPSASQGGFPSFSPPTAVNGIAPPPKISFAGLGEQKPALSEPFGGDKAPIFPPAADTAKGETTQSKPSFFASPSPAFASASTSKPTASAGVPAISPFSSLTGTSKSILSSDLGSKPLLPSQSQSPLNADNKPSPFPPAGDSLDFLLSGTLDKETPKGGISTSPFSDSLLGQKPKTAEEPALLRPGTLQSSSSGFPGLGSPTTSRKFDPAASTTPTSSPPRSAIFSTTPLSPAPPRPVTSPRDLLGDFTKWFVNGDNGLMKEFEIFMVENIVRETFDKFQKDEKERMAREKEEQDEAEAKRFRIYNLSLKYFYRWKKTARERRLRQLRQSGRDQFRAFREAQRAAQLREEQEATRRMASQKAELASLNRPDELATILKKNRQSKRKAEEALLASGVLSGVANERRAVSAIFRNDYRLSPTPSSINGSQGIRSRSGSIASTEGGSKTRALRERLLGEKPGRFQRSLPSVSAGSSPPEKSRVSKVSERWRLKAMGIVQLPDGTALPESMVDDIKRGLKKDTGFRGSASLRGSLRGSASLRESTLIRRASITSAASTIAAAAVRPQSPMAFTSSREDPFLDSPLTINNKRKRSVGDAEETAKEQVKDTDSHKRVMSDADILIQELRAMRQEMEEGTTWFKSQNGKLQSDILSRGGTPLDESIM
ncbi:SAC3/GANP family domain-containing protein [Trichoderma breve]|uniref:SAC3/GANP family domain-containing protein n=1 Tax=Trichoderma breve TaxID=2034170 RepID=A0A9W9B5D9_9HYPO|nr:SAC3/GANP family domain-containing protein [Trichoderma breve]KAJ4856187.1 SAC3/GANP family domain-containing protein [Trichoderma breve]